MWRHRLSCSSYLASNDTRWWSLSIHWKDRTEVSRGQFHSSVTVLAWNYRGKLLTELRQDTLSRPNTGRLSSASQVRYGVSEPVLYFMTPVTLSQILLLLLLLLLFMLPRFRLLYPVPVSPQARPPCVRFLNIFFFPEVHYIVRLGSPLFRRPSMCTLQCFLCIMYCIEVYIGWFRRSYRHLRSTFLTTFWAKSVSGFFPTF
jgi:hypothetical protein